MFARSRYNWASSQIETVLKFDLSVTGENLDLAKRLLSVEYAFEGVYSVRDQRSCDWYDAVYFWCTEQLMANKWLKEEERLPNGILRVFCVIKVACEIKKGNITDPATALEAMQSEYNLFDLGELPS